MYVYNVHTRIWATSLTNMLLQDISGNPGYTRGPTGTHGLRDKAEGENTPGPRVMIGIRVYPNPGFVRVSVGTVTRLHPLV